MKVLLLTDVPPSKAFSGALFTDRLCNFLPKDSLAAYIVINPELKDTPVSPDSAWIPMEFCIKPNESGILTSLRKYGLPFVILSELATFLKETYISIFSIPSIIRGICRFAKKQNIDRVWCILQGQTMIRIALKVAKRLGVPLYSQVWDPPHWWLGANSIDRLTTGKVHKLYEKVLAQSTRMAAASFNMARIYKERYGANTITVIPSLDESLIKEPKVKTGKDCIIIAIAGQIYALDAWNSLLEALDTSGWIVNGKRVIVRIMSYYLPDIAGHNARHIEFLGYRGQEESINILSESDILYLPYWFDKKYDEVVRLSFPSKLTAYLAAGKPILCHAPDYSSPASFLNENKAGFCCNSVDKKDVIDSICYIDRNPDLVRQTTENGRAALRKFLSVDFLAKCFADFLETNPESLRDE